MKHSPRPVSCALIYSPRHAFNYAINVSGESHLKVSEPAEWNSRHVGACNILLNCIN